MKKLNIYRLNVSPYQPKTFFENEKRQLESLSSKQLKLNYSFLQKDSEIEPDVPSILLTNTSSNLTPYMGSDQVKLIIHSNSGYDNFNVEFVKNSAFPIVVGNLIRAQAVANYILSAIFQRFTKFGHQAEWDKSRTWPRTLLNEKRVQLIGCGHIGNILKNALTPLVDEVFVYDSYKNYETLKVKECDILIPCASLNPTSRHFIDNNLLSQLPEDFFIVNAARGKLINQKALLDALKKKSKAFAVMDVFEQEPFITNDFKSLSNVITTSHIAGVFKNINDVIINFEKSVLFDFIKDMDNLETFNIKYTDSLLKGKIKDNFLI